MAHLTQISPSLKPGWGVVGSIEVRHTITAQGEWCYCGLHTVQRRENASGMKGQFQEALNVIAARLGCAVSNVS